MMRMQIAGHINHCQLVAPELSFILFPFSLLLECASGAGGSGSGLPRFKTAFRCL